MIYVSRERIIELLNIEAAKNGTDLIPEDTKMFSRLNEEKGIYLDLKVKIKELEEKNEK